MVQYSTRRCHIISTHCAVTSSGPYIVLEWKDIQLLGYIFIFLSQSFINYKLRGDATVFPEDKS